MMLSSSTHGRTLGRHGVIEHQKSQQLRSIRAGGLAAVAPRIPCGRRDTPEAGSGAPRCVVARAQVPCRTSIRRMQLLLGSHSLQQTLQSSRIKIVNADELQAMIGQRREKPVIVDFFATWCGPCLLLATELEKVSAELGDGLDIYKLDVDAQDNQALSTSLQIQGLPTMLFISPDDQKPVLRTEGLLPADTIKNIVSKEL